MPRLYSGDLAFDVHAEQGEVADDVEYLVTNKFVVETQRRFIEHSVGRKDDRIVERASECEIRLAQHFDLVRKSKGPCRRDLSVEQRSDECLPRVRGPTLKANFASQEIGQLRRLLIFRLIFARGVDAVVSGMALAAGISARPAASAVPLTLVVARMSIGRSITAWTTPRASSGDTTFHIARRAGRCPRG